MKKLALLLALLSFGQAFAQTSTEEFRAKYERQTRVAGQAGIGVETILDKWAESFPDDIDMLVGRYNYYYAKSRRTEVVQKPLAKFMGRTPVMTLKDADGKDVNWFEEDFFDDELYAKSASAIDRAIELRPDELALRIMLLNSLMAYEKECPDMVTMELSQLIEFSYGSGIRWKYDGKDVDDEFFQSMVQEYCVAFYDIASPVSYESFLVISQKMLSYHRKSTLFLSNVGTYWLVVKKNDKVALKQYNKVLKIDPKDYPAAKNCVLIARKMKDVKLEKKYLPALIEASPSENERASSKARLDYLSK